MATTCHSSQGLSPFSREAAEWLVFEVRTANIANIRIFIDMIIREACIESPNKNLKRMLEDEGEEFPGDGL
jgi:hypothetical protein